MLKQKNMTPYWIGFVINAFASWAAYFWLTKMSGYVNTLIFLAALNALIGAWIVKSNRGQRGALVAVVVGLAIGQFWFLLWCLTFLIWKIGGFGP